MTLRYDEDDTEFEDLIQQELNNIVADYRSLQTLSDWTVPTQELDYGSVGGGIPIDEYPIVNDAQNRRYPEQLVTEDYKDAVSGLVDPINFSVPLGMYKQYVSGSALIEYTGSVYNVAPPQVPVDIKKPYKKDAAQYVVVTTNDPDDETQWYSVLMASALWKRDVVETVLNFEFEEF